jgi:hypothetical protein
MACPICNSPEGAAINDGMRAGAAVLIFAASIVVTALVRFALKLWREEALGGKESAEPTS